jgi:hypothetical protein
MPVKGLDEDAAQAEGTTGRYWCHHGENLCTHSYRFLDHGDGTCTCAFFSGSWKRDTDHDAPDIESDTADLNFDTTQKSEDGVPFDPAAYCAKKLNGRCQPGSRGLYNSLAGRCFCGWGKLIDNLVTRDTDFDMTQRSEERVPFDPRARCANKLKGRCPAKSSGIWDSRTGSCFCGWAKYTAELATRDTDADLNPEFDVAQKSAERIPFDPRVYCANTLKGHCPAGTFGLWNSRSGDCFCGKSKSYIDLAARDADLSPPARPVDPFITQCWKSHCPDGTSGHWNVRTHACFCGSARSVVDLVPREEQVESSIPFEPEKICFYAIDKACKNGTVGHWDKERSHCYCRPASNGTSPSVSTSAAGPTTADTLTHLLLPHPLKFPTGTSSRDWTAIQGTLVLLGGVLQSQLALHQVCTDEKNPQVYGFKLELFRKLCSPEIAMPVAGAEVEKAEQKVYAALWIDTVLARYGNDFEVACKDAKRAGQIPESLDRKWILAQLCEMAN